MAATLTNGNFEADWSEEESHRCMIIPASGESYHADIGNIFTPPGWMTWYRHEPGTWDQPEVRDARNAERVHEGDKAILLFTFFRRHCGGFYQQVATQPGAHLRVAGWAHAWSNHRGLPESFPHPDDPAWSEGAGYEHVAWSEGSQPSDTGDPQQDAKANFTFSISIDPTGGINPLADSVVWGDGWHVYNGFVQELSVEATAEASTVTVFLRSRTLWPFKHNDAYFDSFVLEEIDRPCRGRPRVQYERDYVLIPPSHGPAWVNAVTESTWKDRRYTVGGSADDAGIGDLDIRRVIAVNPASWGDDLLGFFAEHYPGVSVRTVNAATPDELAEILSDGEPPPEKKRTRGYIGLHLQGNAAGVADFVRTVKPAVVKLVTGFERAYDVKEWSSHTRVILRHHNDNSGPFIHHPDGPLAGARAWIDQCRDALVAIASGLQASYPDQDPVVYFESVNEVVATGADNSAAYAFDAAFCQAVREMGLPIGPVVFCVAVGNPGESEYSGLVDLARACVDARGMMGYHNYWLANPDYGGPGHLWPYLAGRWTEIDAVLRNYGVEPTWFGGESGAVGGESGSDQTGLTELLRRIWARLTRQVSPRWVHLDPHDGWKSDECLGGDWPRYLGQIMRFDELTAEWDAAFSGRFAGSVLFTTSGPGWDSFDIGEREIADIGDSLLARYPEIEED